MVGFGDRVGLDEIFDSGQNVGVEVGNGFQTDGFHQQVVQLDFALEFVHFLAVAPLIVGVGQCPDAAAQSQCDRQPEPSVLPEGGQHQNVHSDGIGRDIAQQSRYFQPVASGRQVIELHLTSGLRLRPLVLESFQTVAVAHVSGGGMGNGDVGESQVAQSVFQADTSVVTGQSGLPVDVIG